MYQSSPVVLTVPYGSPQAVAVASVVYLRPVMCSGWRGRWLDSDEKLQFSGFGL